MGGLATSLIMHLVIGLDTRQVTHSLEARGYLNSNAFTLKIYFSRYL